MLMYSLCLLCSFSELLLTVISCNACALCHWVSIKATYLLTYFYPDDAVYYVIVNKHRVMNYEIPVASY